MCGDGVCSGGEGKLGCHGRRRGGRKDYTRLLSICLFCRIIYFINNLYTPPGGGGGESHADITGMLVEIFKNNL